MSILIFLIVVIVLLILAIIGIDALAGLGGDKRLYIALKVLAVAVAIIAIVQRTGVLS